MKRYRLNTAVGKYSTGDVVSEDEIKNLLNIPQCLQCGWLIPDTPEQTTKEGFVWTESLVLDFLIMALSPKYAHIKSTKKLMEDFKASKQSPDKFLHNLAEDKLIAQSLSNTPKEEKYYYIDPWDMEVKEHDIYFNNHWVKSFYTKEDAEKYLSKIKPKEEQPSKEKDWEIMLYGYAQNNEGKPEQQYIHSVRRLSDNEVFSVGDDVCLNWYPVFTIKQPIEKFEIKDGKMMVYYKSGESNGIYELKYCRINPSTKPSEQPKERIEVLNFSQKVGAPKSRYEVRIGSGQTIPEEKFPLIKRCIEYVLNGEAKEYWRLVDELLPGQLKYTQEQLDKAIEETWKAARKLDEWDYHHTPYQYRTLADYLSSIKKQ